MTNNELKEAVKKINYELLKREPGNISFDNYSGYTGYKPQYVIDCMNKYLWGEWGFEELNTKIHQIDPKSALSITQVKVWIKGIEFQPTAYGQSRVTRGDMGDAYKGSQTDAIKKALSYFSIGNRAYHGLLKSPVRS